MSKQKLVTSLEEDLQQKLAMINLAWILSLIIIGLFYLFHNSPTNFDFQKMLKNKLTQYLTDRTVGNQTAISSTGHEDL